MKKQNNLTFKEIIEKNNKFSNKGITLIALVITIIILLILAGVTIAQLTGNGLFEKAKLAKEKYENAQANEIEKVNNLSSEIDLFTSRNVNTNDDLKLIEYVKETNILISNGATAAKEDVELQNGKYLMIVSTKISDYKPEISLIGDDSIREITPMLSYNGNGEENRDGYHSRKRIW